MNAAGLIRTIDSENFLWHWDLSARNILVKPVTTDSVATKIPKEQEKSTNGSVEADQSKGCLHSVQFSVDNAKLGGHRHTVDVKIEDESGKCCKHAISFSVTDSSGRLYQHTLDITNAADSKIPHQVPAAGHPHKESEGYPSNEVAPQKPAQSWEISGVLDWDDATSAPLVLARKPISWLWLSEDDTDGRDSDWNLDRDAPPGRDLTQDELLIKAHFDQTMERLSPGYIEDTYHRGV